MKSPFYFIVKPTNGKRYDNTRQVGEIDLIVSTSEEDHNFSNRYAEVVELPLGYTGPINIGNTLLVHHNVFKFYNDMRGRQKSGKSFFRDDLFFIEPDQFFLYNDGSTWNTYDRYCFVKPMPTTESYVYKPFSYEPLMGIVKYSNQYLMDNNIFPNDMVCFTPDNEYEFTVDGEKLYRISDNQITIKL